MQFPHILDKLYPSSVRNVIIYLSAIVLVLSLVISFNGISNQQAQKVAFLFLIYGFYLLGLRNWVYDCWSNKKIATSVRAVLALIGFIITIKFAFY